MHTLQNNTYYPPFQPPLSFLPMYIFQRIHLRCEFQALCIFAVTAKSLLPHHTEEISTHLGNRNNKLITQRRGRLFQLHSVFQTASLPQ